MESLAQWFAATLGQHISAQLVVFIVSLFPILECRGGLLAASLLKVDIRQAVPICIIGNLIPVPFIIVYISNENADFELELTWLRDHPQKYDIGEEEFHLAFKTDDFEAAHKLHEEMGCICFENHSMGIYFIQDPDGYWLEVIPERR